MSLHDLGESKILAPVSLIMLFPSSGNLTLWNVTWELVAKVVVKRTIKWAEEGVLQINVLCHYCCSCSFEISIVVVSTMSEVDMPQRVISCFNREDCLVNKLALLTKMDAVSNLEANCCCYY